MAQFTLSQDSPGSRYRYFGFKPYLGIINIILTTLSNVNAGAGLVQCVKAMKPKYERSGSQYFRAHPYD